jgi:hypothetical protein
LEKGYSCVLDVRIYEVSHCGGPGQDCGPGDGDAYGGADGIDPTLYVKLNLKEAGLIDYNHTKFGKVSFVSTTFTIPDDAVIFAETQDNLKGVIDDK